MKRNGSEAEKNHIETAEENKKNPYMYVKRPKFGSDEFIDKRERNLEQKAEAEMDCTSGSEDSSPLLESAGAGDCCSSIKSSTAPNQSILLDEDNEVFRNTKNAKRFAIDIGGSLTKIAYFSTVKHRRVRYGDAGATEVPNGNSHSNPSGDCDVNPPEEEADSFAIYETFESPRLHFMKFETKYIEQCLDFIQTNLVAKEMEGSGPKLIKATGGGAYKYADLIEERLGMAPEKEDEVACLIKGANFLLKNVAHEAFTFERKRKPSEYHFLPAGPVLFPYLLVNIGSGVSILKVEGEDEYERIGGTATGGGTFWGLGTLLTGAKGFDELLTLAEQGDHRNVDMLVKDIYSGDYQRLGLPGDLIASSFGKAAHAANGDYSSSDVARSLLFTISNDIGQIACLHAMHHKLKRIYFGGYFLRNHPLSMHTVSYAIKYWSRDTVEPLFLRHEGYLGAVGAFLKSTEELETDKYSWQENFAGSSGFTGSIDNCNGSSSGSTMIKFPSGLSVDQLLIDRAEEQIGFFTLLDSNAEYFPDTVDLIQDDGAREYWLNCFEGTLERITARAMESQPDVESATSRALQCRHKLLQRLHLLRTHPCAYGNLTVRSLLDTIEQCLREFDFPDPYLEQKQLENSVALKELDQRLVYLDSLEFEPRNIELICGVLAGNIFDWGAKAVTNFLEGPDTFGFIEARAQLQERPWLIDCLDNWIQRLETGAAHKCVTIFVDNSGYDFVLGIIPLVRDFLKRGTEVILCANSDPALNDMTYGEMIPLLRQISSKCPIISQALKDKRLIPHGNGQASPCLDLSRISQDLNYLVQKKACDLVIIEGMGRSIHTNLHAQFHVEVLKLAVIKNSWLAKQLGGDVFSVVCKYEKPADELS